MYRPLQFHKRSQLFIGSHDEPLFVVAVRICNKDWLSLEARTRSALATAIAKAAEAVASQEASPVASVAALKDLVLAGAKHFGWEVNQTPSVSVQGEKVAVVFDEKRTAGRSTSGKLGTKTRSLCFVR
jgi:hypothetical protein